MKSFSVLGVSGFSIAGFPISAIKVLQARWSYQAVSGLVVIRVFSYHLPFTADGKAERLLSPTTMVAAGRRQAGFRAASQSEFDPGE
jgi:hypothetical protein